MSDEKTSEDTSSEEKPEILFKYELDPRIAYALLNFIRVKEVEVAALIPVREAIQNPTNLEEVRNWEEEKKKKKEEEK